MVKKYILFEDDNINTFLLNLRDTFGPYLAQKAILPFTSEGKKGYWLSREEILKINYSPEEYSGKFIAIIDTNNLENAFHRLGMHGYGEAPRIISESEVNDILKMNNHNSMFSWDYIKWIKDFKLSSEKKYGFRELRSEVFQHTVKIVKNHGYYVNEEFIKLNINESNDNLQKNTIFYENVENIFANNDKEYNTKFSVINADCIEIANLLRKIDYNPVVLNMANRRTPGGGVIYGAGAQEENIFRRSNIFLSLFQFSNYAQEYGLKRDEKYSYPLNMESGGIYSPNVTIFRASEQNGYFLLKEPFELSFVTVPAINNPETKEKDNKYELVDNLIEPTKLKIRTILRIALINNHDSIVLSAFGCGAFRNPPEHISLLFKEVLQENEFSRKFKLIIFAIIDDHNSWQRHNPEGNIIPFQKVFD